MALQIIPQPQKVEEFGHLSPFRLSSLCALQTDNASEPAAQDLLRFLEKIFEITPMGGSGLCIRLAVKQNADLPESYTLTVSETEVCITGADKAGVFWGVQTLKQLLFQCGEELPQLKIADSPRFSFRSLMLDVSRHFFTVEAVKLLLDAMALHKLNRLHLHLTDDQGWRMAIDSHPLLEQIGSVRAYTNWNKTPHRGCYSKEDLRELNAYAAARCIRIIPEISMPGHSVAAIAAYPVLSCENRDLDVATDSGVYHDILCAGKESTSRIMEAVLDEVCAAFPGSEVHLGANDVSFKRWEACPHCKARMQQEGLQTPAALYTRFLEHMAEYLQNKGVQPLIWQDPALAQPSACLPFCFDSPKDPAAPWVCAARPAFALDLPHSRGSLRDCYAYEVPSPAPLGVEATLWTDFIGDLKRAGQQLFPRLGAFCETAWCDPAQKDYACFLQKLPAYERLLQTLPMDYSSRRKADPGAVQKGAESIRDAFRNTYIGLAQRRRDKQA